MSAYLIVVYRLIDRNRIGGRYNRYLIYRKTDKIQENRFDIPINARAHLENFHSYNSKCISWHGEKRVKKVKEKFDLGLLCY